MNPYVKSLTATLGTVLTVLNGATTPDTAALAHWIPSILSAVIAAAVYLFPNISKPTTTGQ